MKKFRYFISFITVITIFYAVCGFSSAHAANVCESISGSLADTVEFTVVTGGKLLSGDSVKLQQKKGTMHVLPKFSSSYSAVERYGNFKITVYDVKTRNYIYNQKEWGDKTFTISGAKLKKNSTYKIIVQGVTEEHFLDGAGNNMKSYGTLKYYYEGWYEFPVWTVTKTGGNVTLCQEDSEDQSTSNTYVSEAKKYEQGNIIENENSQTTQGTSSIRTETKPTASTYAQPTITLSTSSLNLDFHSKQSDTIGISLSGSLPQKYKMDFECESNVKIAWGEWSNDSRNINLTITATEETTSGSVATIYLRDNDGNTYATAAVAIHVTFPQESAYIEAPSRVGLDYAKSQTTTITMKVSGTILQGTTLQGECTPSIQAKWEKIDENTIKAYVTANWKLKDADGVLTAKIVNKNGEVLDSAKITIYNTTPLYSVVYNANGGYYSPSYESEYLAKKSGTQYKGFDYLISLDPPLKDGYVFLGWSKSPNATTPEFKSGDHYTEGNDVVLYAVWEKLSYSIEASEEDIYVYDDSNNMDQAPFDDVKYYDENGDLIQTVQTSLYGKIDLSITGSPYGIYTLDWECKNREVLISVDDTVRSGDVATLIIGGVVGEKNADIPVILYLMDGEERLCSKTINIHLRDSEPIHTLKPTAKPSQNGITVYVDGEKIEFDVQPQLINDRTMVPLRAIFEALGADVEWDEESQAIVAYLDYTTIVLYIGDNEMYRNGEIVVIDTPPIITDGRTLVPVRAIAESFDCVVEWNSEDSCVDIYDYDYYNTNYSDGKYISHIDNDWGDENISLHSYDVPYKQLAEPVENCTQFTLHFGIHDIENGNPFGLWHVYAFTKDSWQWINIYSFDYPEDATAVEEVIELNYPRTIYAIALVRDSDEPSDHMFWYDMDRYFIN